MKVINLTKSSVVYTANAYLVLGRWNSLDDKNTLVDVGRDPSIILRIINTHTGVGKKRIDRVVLTHNHYNHTSILPLIREKFDPEIFAFSSKLDDVDYAVKDGQQLQIADRMFEVIHTPFHSEDSICLYCEEEEILFSGDTPLLNDTKLPVDNKIYLQSLRKLANYEITKIYTGHRGFRKYDFNKRIQHVLKLIEG